MTATNTLDLDAARRESQRIAPTIVLGGQSFVLPLELPADVIDPLLSDELDLVGLVKQVLADKPTSTNDVNEFLDLLFARPALPRQLIAAVKDSLALLFGADAYAAFLSQRPSFSDYVRIVKALPGFYGVGLGEAFASPGSSESDGATSKETSESTADSTPAASGGTPETSAAS